VSHSSAIATGQLLVRSDIAALPALHSGGTVYSLRRAMQRDTSGTLKTLVQACIAKVDQAQRSPLIDQIL